MGFPRQEYWNGLPFPTPGDLPDPGIEPMSLVSPALAGGLFTSFATWKSSQELRTEDRAVKNQAPNITSPGAYIVLVKQKEKETTKNTVY